MTDPHQADLNRDGDATDAPKQANTLWANATAELRGASRRGTGAGAEPLHAIVERGSDLTRGASDLIEAAAEMVRWEVPPPLDPRERSSWVPVDPPAPVSSAVSPVRSLKLKGVGLGTVHGPAPPSTEPYQDRLMPEHVGITYDGRFCLQSSESAPLGGMFLDRALREYRNAEILHRAGCPSTTPIAVFRYEGLECDWQPGRPLGVAVTGGPTLEPLRVCGLMVSDPEADDIYGRACAELLSSWGPDRSSALRRVAVEAGRTLRDFHEAGLYRHPSYPTNYLFDPQADRISLLDLDSSRELSECEPVRRPLEVLRDVAGGVFNLGRIFLDPWVAERFPPDSLARAGMFRAFVASYFADTELPNMILERFEEHYFSQYEQVYARRQEITSTAIGEEILQSLWLDRKFCYGTVVADLSPVYNSSSLSEKYPFLIDTAEISKNAVAFFSEEGGTSW